MQIKKLNLQNKRGCVEINFSSADCTDNSDFSFKLSPTDIIYLCNLRYLWIKNQEFAFRHILFVS